MGEDFEETYYGLYNLWFYSTKLRKMKTVRYNANLKLIGRRLYGKV